MSIAAFYQCYKQPLAFDHCLQQFRKHYPTSELWIVNDGGDRNLESIAEKYNPTHYEYQTNISSESNQLIYTESSKILKWLSRLRKCVMATSADYLMLLEDDVFVMKPTPLETLHYDLNGCNKGVRFPNNAETLIRILNPNVPNPLYYGGCGGCILRVSFLKTIFGNAERDVEQFALHCNIFASDMVLSYLIWINGGTIDQYPGFAETWYTDYKTRLENGTIEVLHQYKELYGYNINPMKNSQGYVFIANGLMYANMLKEYTIASIRHFDKVRPITILTSTPEYFDTSVYTVIVYDAKEQTEKYKYLNPSDYFINGTIPKLIIFDLSPYDENLYLDADVINMKDINTFWSFCSSSNKQIVIAGGSDSNNDAPPSWHWNTIQEVIKETGIHIPRINGGVHYWKKTIDFMTTIQPYLADQSKYKIKPWFRESYVDEIFISIYLGIKGIYPESDEDASPPNPESIQTYRTHYSPSGNNQFFHVFNKNILYQYFNLFLERNSSF